MVRNNGRVEIKRGLSLQKNEAVCLSKVNVGRLVITVPNGVYFTYGHKKRSTAVLQPLLTLNLIL